MEVYEYTVTPEDLEAFGEHELETTAAPAIRRAAAVGGLTTAGTLLVLFVVAGENLAFAAGFGGLAGVIVWLIHPPYTRGRIRREIQAERARAPDIALGPFELIVADDSFILKGKLFEERVSWEGVWKLETTDSHAFLYTGPGRAVVIPLLQIDAMARTRLKEVLRRRVGPRALVPAS